MDEKTQQLRGSGTLEPSALEGPEEKTVTLLTAAHEMSSSMPAGPCRCPCLMADLAEGSGTVLEWLGLVVNVTRSRIT